MNHRRILTLFIERWLEQVSRLDYSTLCVAQPRPHASIACGAAGIAVALARASHSLRLPELKTAATRWAAAASQARREDFINRAAGMRNVAGSLWFGPNGATAVSAALEEKFDFALPDGLRKNDVVRGRAGWLPLLLRLERYGVEPGRADRIAHALVRSRAYASGGVGFAHGRLGIQHALLGWAKRRARALPAAFWKALDASTVLDRRLKAEGALARSWCNGSAGLLLTQTQAYETSTDARYLVAARQTARHVATRADDAGGDLCCGYGGRAYALATFARSDPSGNWLEQARDLALRAVLFANDRWPNGLLKGWPGLVCLALDLVDGRAEFPFVHI